MTIALKTYNSKRTKTLDKFMSQFFNKNAFEKNVSTIRRNPLTKSFMNVAEKSGLKIAFKLAAAGTASAMGANVYVVVLAGGLGVTIAEAIKEYHDDQKQQASPTTGLFASIKNFFGFIKKEKRKYYIKFIKNSGLGLIGAEIGSHISEIKDFIMHIPGMLELTKLARKIGQSLFNGILGISSSHASEIKKIVQTNNIVPLIETSQSQVTNIYEKLSQINTKSWDSQALSDFKAAQAGKSWALQNLAHYSANGLHGMPVNLESARSLAEEAGLKGSGLSAKFLSELDQLPKSAVMEVNNVDDVTEASNSVIAAPRPNILSQFSITHMDKQALADFKAAQAGKSWALQNLAHYSANGLHGMPVNLEFARSLAEEAGLQGSRLSAKFLSELDQFPKSAVMEVNNVDDVTEASNSVIAASRPNILSQFSITHMDKQALADFKAAQAGKSWALQNLAHYSANGLHGMPVNLEFARSLAEEAGLQGSRLSAKFLSELDQSITKEHYVAGKADDVFQSASIPSITNNIHPKNLVSSPIANNASADSNICVVSTEGLRGKYKQFANVDFVMDCSNPDTLIASGTDVIVKLNYNDKKLNFINGTSNTMRVSDMAQYIATTLLYNQELFEQSYEPLIKPLFYNLAPKNGSY